MRRSRQKSSRYSRAFVRLWQGFTLIELLLVIGIIALLASIVIIAVNPARQLSQARNAARRKDGREILNAVQQYVIQNGSLPGGIDTTLRMIGTEATGCSVLCNAGGAPVTIIPFSTRVAAGTDDAEEALLPAWNGWSYATSNDLELSDDPDPIHLTELVGIRFQSLPIPAGATVVSAAITFTVLVDEPATPAAALTIQGQAADNAPAFTSNSTFTGITHDISGRTRTAAAVAWSPPDDWTVTGQARDTPDLSSILQEIVSRPGWMAGNSAVYIVEGSGTRGAFSFDGNPNAAAVLSLTYAVGSDITAESCLNLNTLSGTYLTGLPRDPSLGSAGKTYYAVKKLASNRISVQACGAEMGEEITVEQ